MRWRVVCALREVMLTFWPTSAFSSVDLPTLGGRRWPSVPQRLRIGFGASALRVRRVHRDGRRFPSLRVGHRIGRSGSISASFRPSSRRPCPPDRAGATSVGCKAWSLLGHLEQRRCCSMAGARPARQRGASGLRRAAAATPVSARALHMTTKVCSCWRPRVAIDAVLRQRLLRRACSHSCNSVLGSLPRPRPAVASSSAARTGGATSASAGSKPASR